VYQIKRLTDKHTTQFNHTAFNTIYVGSP